MRLNVIGWTSRLAGRRRSAQLLSCNNGKLVVLWVTCQSDQPFLILCPTH